MKKFPKIRYPSHEETDGLLDGEIVVTEKLDGANFRFTFTEGGEIVAGSRNVTFTEGDDPLPVDEINTDFRHAIEYLQIRLPPKWRMKEIAGEWWGVDISDVTFYGEAMHRHSIEYDGIEYGNNYGGGAPHPVDDTPSVVIFDAQLDGEWVHWNIVETFAADFNLVTTNVIERGDPEGASFQVPAMSTYGDHPPEGIVVRRVDGSVRTKKVTDEFKEKNAVSFEDPSKAQSDAAEFVAMYVTEARIEKLAHKLRDEGEYESLKMEMMEDLPRYVLEDVMSEEGWDLLTNPFEAEWDQDFKGEVRSKASGKCARVLKSTVQQI